MNTLAAYIKPKSLTFWVSFAPLLGGLIIATASLHGFDGLTMTVSELSGDMTAHQLILVGLGGIGVRRALDR